MGYYYSNKNGELVWCLTDKSLRNVQLTRDSSRDTNFIDDEYPISEDDDLYDNYVDANEEWVGDEKNICDDDIRNLSSDTNEKINRDKPQYPQFVVDTDMANLEFNFRAIVREYVIKNGRNVKSIENEKDKVRVVCPKGCHWVAYVVEVRNEKTFQVRTYNGQHTCSRVFKNDNVKSRYLCNKYVNHFRSNLKLSIGAFMIIVRNSLAYEVSPRTYINQYAKLPNYCAEMRRTNSGSIVILKTELVEDKGLVSAIEKLLLNYEHGHCLRHLYNNCKQNFKGLALKDRV
ncbi:hypothetical protein PVL29_027177 [Vitis rotundifolia]|uniref:Transposase MuDR plant domain-containing protein n=1 Tax=Vitis rotundifolia TaxID=103349 RepID=A0AA38YIF3_VITRO|nr:hypothetical protein PVL29_027177 [Vitis rotundifolia]